MRDEQDLFKTLRTIKNKPNSTQRELAEELGFSLGKLNYCLRALKDKGFVKIEKIKDVRVKTIPTISYDEVDVRIPIKA